MFIPSIAEGLVARTLGFASELELLEQLQTEMNNNELDMLQR